MKQHRFLQFLFGILLSSALLAGSVVLTLNFRPLYARDVEAYDLSARTGLSEETILAQYDALIAYNRIGGPDELVFPDLPSSETGIIHFAETKTIFLAFQWWAIIAGAASVLGIVLLRRRRPKRYLKYAGLISLIFPAVVGAGIALMWDKVFVLFHSVMFRNDYWIFNAQTDPIINLLPDGFFMHCAIMIVAVYMLSGVACLVLYALSRRKRPAPQAHSPAI